MAPRLFLPLLLCGLLAGAAGAEPLTLRQAEELALRQNLALQSGVYGYRAAAAGVGENRGLLYDPQLRLFAAQGATSDALNLVGTPESSTRYTRLDAGVSQTLPTGGSLSLGLNNLREDDNDSAVAAFDPSWRSELRLSLVQPLLKGAGREALEEPLLLAVKGEEAADAALEQTAVALLAAVRDQFAEIRRAGEVTTSREASLAVASTLLDENRAKVEAGVLPPLDILEAEVGLKLRERELLDARQNWQDQLDRLAELLDLLPPVEAVNDPFVAESVETDEAADVAAALQRRPDLRQARIDEESLRLQGRLAGDRRKPRLDLSASYAQKGLDGDYGDDLDQTLSRDLPSWEVGLTFTYPLGNRQARNEALRKQALADARHSEVGAFEAAVRREVRATSRQLLVGTARLEVTATAVEFAEEKLKTLLKRRSVGLATTRAVLEGEADLAQARTDRADAQAAYEKALTAYLVATGRLLDHERVQLGPGRNTVTPYTLLPATP